MKLRVSLVEYLNAAPLGWSMLYGPHRDLFEVLPSVPSRCADQLASGEVDIGLIPSIEYQRIPGLQIVPGIAIAAERPVRSVILVKKRVPKIQTVALDTSSRSSAALVELLLRTRLGLDPKFLPRRPSLPGMLDGCDAALLIGDAALKLERREYEVLDLAEEWIAWQKTPFVFAFWACRMDARLPENIVTIFHEARAWGVNRFPEIVKVYSRKLNLPEDFLLDYLSRNITYDMGKTHVGGLESFYRLAGEAGMIPKVLDARFLPEVPHLVADSGATLNAAT